MMLIKVQFVTREEERVLSNEKFCARLCATGNDKDLTFRYYGDRERLRETKGEARCFEGTDAFLAARITMSTHVFS